MKIDAGNELREMEPDIKSAADYLSCEKVLIHNMKKHVKKGASDADVHEYTRQLAAYYTAQTAATQNTSTSINYRYAAAFLNVLMCAPHFCLWIESSRT